LLAGCLRSANLGGGMSKERFELLDVMRGIAALAVVVGHANDILGDPKYTGSTGLAVDFFFCLSGFVVAHAYGDRLQAGALSYGRFVYKRLLRLFPMILIGALLGFAAHLYVNHEAAWVDGAMSMVMIPRLSGYLAFPLDVPMWSLPYEIGASLAFGLVVKICPKVIPWALVVSGIVLAACVWKAGHVISFGVGSAPGIAKGLLRITYPVLLGAVLCRYRNRLPRVPSFVAPLALVAVLLTVTPWTGPYQTVAVMIVLPLIVAAGVKGTVSPRLLFLERLSYPLYLVHWPVLLMVCHTLQGRAPGPVVGAVAIATACAVAWLLLVAYDEPARRWLASRLDLLNDPQLAPKPALAA